MKLYLLVTCEAGIPDLQVFRTPASVNHAYDGFAGDSGLESDEDGEYDWGESENVASMYVLDTDKGELV